MTKKLLVILLICLLPISAWGLTEYYVDPDWAGTKSGTEAEPWSKLDSTTEWDVINTALSSDDVTVYFSARDAASDTNQQDTTVVRNIRTDTGSKRVTLDGKSYYNTNDLIPSWSAYSGSSMYEITNGTCITTNTALRSNYTITGFTCIGGTLLYHWGGDNVIVEDCIADGNGGAASSPAIYVQYKRKNGDHENPCVPDIDHSCNSNDNIIIRNNEIFECKGECVYVGGINERRTAVSSVNERHRLNEAAHTNITITGNTIYDAGTGGGEADGIDFKPGNTGVLISDNTVYMTTPTEGADGIVVDCGATIEGNFVYNFGKNGIKLASFWNTYATRNNTIVRNNIVVNTGGAVTSQDNGILVEFFCEDITNGVESQFKWEVSGNGTNEYYLTWVDDTDPDGYDPSLGREPDYVWMGSTRATNGVIGSLSDHQWDYGDNDTLGYSTIYFRDDSGDPDSVDPDLCMEYDQFTGAKIYNNSVYGVQNDGLTEGGIAIQPTGYSYNIEMANNIVMKSLGREVVFDATAVTTHDYNLLYDTAGDVYYDGTNTVAYNGTLTTYEPNSINNLDPDFIDTSIPYIDTNFKLQTGSPAIGEGVPGLVIDDYDGFSRANPPAMGAYRWVTSTGNKSTVLYNANGMFGEHSPKGLIAP